MEDFKPSYIMTLVHGLRDDSRIKMRFNHSQVGTDRVIFAYMADKLANLVWMLSEDGKNGVKQPKSILSILLGNEEKKDEENVGYDSPEAFEMAMKKYEVN